MMLEDDDRLKSHMRTQYEKLEQELAGAEAQLSEIDQARSARRSVDEEVVLAMKLYDDVQRVTDDPHARADIQPLLTDLGLNVGLNFVEATKGKKRKVRKLVSGVIAFDDKLLCKEPYRGGVRHGREDFEPDREDKTSMSASRSTNVPREGVSFTKGNRGGQI